MEVCRHEVTIECPHYLVFVNGLVTSVLGKQHLGFCHMRHWAAWRRSNRLLGEILRAHDIGRGGSGHISSDARRKVDR